MPFPAVKTSPWDKGKRPRRKRSGLWSGTFWRKLVKQAKSDQHVHGREISPVCLEMIGDMNEWLYGNR
jgi:hypothetical protein